MRNMGIIVGIALDRVTLKWYVGHEIQGLPFEERSRKPMVVK